MQKSFFVFGLLLPIFLSSSPSLAKDVKSVAPEAAAEFLKQGNARFLSGQVKKTGDAAKDIQRLSTGQNPHSIVVSCSDSRVPPEIVFDQKLGEIFTVRSAGEAVDNNTVGSIEYAVAHLGSRLVVIMGHTNCGGVKAALDTLNGQPAETPALTALVNELHPHLLAFKDKPRSKDLVDEGWANVDGVIEDLLGRSELLRTELAKGHIEFQPALYHLDSGVVQFGKILKQAPMKTKYRLDNRF